MASFSTPLSGLTAAQQQLQSISNNLANLNTVGYKDQTVNFSDVFSDASQTNGSGDPLQIGYGVQTSSTTSDFTDGNPTTTNVSSNMALSGNGFFVTEGSSGVPAYTRAGNFTTNNSGQLVAPDGSLVMGYPAVAGVVDTSAALQPLQVVGGNSPAVATTKINVTANLNSSTAVGASGGASTFPIYDSLGQAHTLSIQYTNAGNNTWNYSVTIPSADLTPGGTGTTQVASGTLNFNTSGQLQLPGTPPSSNIAITIPSSSGAGFADGAASMSMNWSLVDQSGNPTITQTASASATSATSQNGYTSGSLMNYTVQSDGTIEGSFTSGATMAIGQVALASFANVQGLAAEGNNNYQTTQASGAAVIGVAGTGGRGTIIGGSTESSNVDIATEFAKMIVAQQAYSANAKSITTFNQVSQATIAMIQ